jgi:hypothetical protein
MTDDLLQRLSVAQLRRALAVREKMESLEAELAALVGDMPTPRQRRMSPAGRARIAASARARWARVKAAGGRTLAAVGSRKRRL